MFINQLTVDNVRTDNNIYELIPIPEQSEYSEQFKLSRSPEYMQFYTDKFNYNHINRAFVEALGFNLKTYNVVVAGGAICRFIRSGQIDYTNDIDIYFIGHNAYDRLINILEEMQPQEIYLSNNCVTVMRNGYIIQFILRYYKNYSDIFRYFDIGSSMICFNGKKFYTSAEGRLAYKCFINIINLSKYQYSYDNRLIKYYNLGFHILHTDKNADKFHFGTIYKNDRIETSYSGSSYTAQFRYKDDKGFNEINNIKFLTGKIKFFKIRVDMDQLRSGIVHMKFSDQYLLNYFYLHGANVFHVARIKKCGLFTVAEEREIYEALIDNCENEKILELLHKKIRPFSVSLKITSGNEDCLIKHDTISPLIYYKKYYPVYLKFCLHRRWLSILRDL